MLGKQRHTNEALTLDPAERNYLQQCSFSLPLAGTPTQRAKVANTVMQKALQALQTRHMCILHNALSSDELEVLMQEYRELLDFTGHPAIGETDAVKRSGTRLYNCACQKGNWDGWRRGSGNSRRLVGVGLSPCGGSKCETSPPTVWRQILRRLKFEHVVRVEVVTSHDGCRNQAWHIDGDHGLTVIFALASVGLRKGPTQLDLSIPFVSLQEDGPKVQVR